MKIDRAEDVRVLKVNRSTILTIEKLSSELSVNALKLQLLAIDMVGEFIKGLESDNESINMIPSYVVTLPSGAEKGQVLALDMGGSNFRVLWVKLEGSGGFSTKGRKFSLTDEYKKMSGELLFDFFADSVKSFIDDEGLGAGPYIIAFTFSFAVEQTSIKAGKLMGWSKGFENEGVIGNDVVKLLEDAFVRKNVKASVSALVNDPVGTLIYHYYKDSRTYVGMVLGTGTNAAYIENASHIPKWKSDDGIVVINTEWGGYGNTATLPISSYDKMVDRFSENPTKQIYEKMISGLYLGEIARYIMLDLVRSGDLFKGTKSDLLYERYSFLTAYMSRIERDNSLELTDTKSVLEDLMKVSSTSYNDRRIVKHMCELVGTRAARLAAAGVAALVTKINKLDGCVVAIDGSLYEHYPHFGDRMRDAVREILGIKAGNIILEHAGDGSGQGAALIAELHKK
jgi:hexokinase